MTQDCIQGILKEFLDWKGEPHEGGTHFPGPSLVYESNQIPRAIQDLAYEADQAGFTFVEHAIHDKELDAFLDQLEVPALFLEDVEGNLVPWVIRRKGKEQMAGRVDKLSCTYQNTWPLGNMGLARNEDGLIRMWLGFPQDSLVSGTSPGDGPKLGKKLSPVRRLFRLLAMEKRDIVILYIYAAIIGLVNLMLPLGIQATIGLVSGGVFLSSIGVLIGIVIITVLLAGLLQIMQISIVEHLQRRVFAKAAFEFTHRIPRMKLEAIFQTHAPELVNRFFDVMTIQKGIPKLLIDLSSAALQILFSLILLAFYDPVFIIFGVILVAFLTLMFYITGPKGLNTSITESKYKYKVAYWLEELARTMYSFKMAGASFLPIKKTHGFVNNYLAYRKAHFKVLINQYTFVVIFKTLITGGLLALGAYLVFNRTITLGQFVASEVIIILLLGAVEKIIMYMDVVYDMLTAVDKIGQVTDVPLEKTEGLSLPDFPEGMPIHIKNLSYRYPHQGQAVLDNVNLDINPGEKIALVGASGSGKTTLVHLLTGMYEEYEGTMQVGQYSLRNISPEYLRDVVAKNVSHEDIFEGTILENIQVGKPQTTVDDAIWALKKVGLLDQVYAMEGGLESDVMPGGKVFSNAVINRLILARCLAKKPKVLILNDFFVPFTPKQKRELLRMLLTLDDSMTLIMVTTDPVVMAQMDRLLVLEGGKIVGDGAMEELREMPALAEVTLIPTNSSS
ncbi:MAG TPA: xenobiotic-transporting ATPase [Cytophagales bacterium]|nr:xenobiotic-transporting ATPase [Cytophagales bacterium]HAA22551.1 xenobiotic-transporting ATPase [Cytophagales bacterium]HAP60928.1 xenobiotic-transporting ATPase [Cytophagales bacterium]